MSENGDKKKAPARAEAERIDGYRERIAKAWLMDLIRDSPLAELESVPMPWAAGELPELVDDILAAIGDDEGPGLGSDQLARIARLAELRGAGAAPGQVVREVSTLQTSVLSILREDLPASKAAPLVDMAARLAGLFGDLNAAAVDALFQSSDRGRDPVTGLHRTKLMKARLAQMVAAAKRYEHPFAVVLLDVEGPGTRDESNGSGQDAILAVVAAALRGSIRLVDEAFLLDESELCVLAPNQTVANAVLMAERLAELLAELEEAGGLHITVSAGVAACPEHGEDPEELLRQADTAMWRARATGQPVSVGDLQDR
jgi:diguanylate cyclase (GGDEF)-like protein